MTSIDCEIIASGRYTGKQILANLVIHLAFNYSPQGTRRSHENPTPNREVEEISQVMI
jgi:hypothetical protein